MPKDLIYLFYIVIFWGRDELDHLTFCKERMYKTIKKNKPLSCVVDYNLVLNGRNKMKSPGLHSVPIQKIFG